ncbi:Dps family protein [Paenibacillus sp. YN15]|uniref:Dps family protein n=1 Tax=Paenibacillus sp. YN15 TaxID=1742774 RepID=UPI000DCCD2B4|nr:Dps family protein [Paenibacillus sp. YN15]RAU91078.1 DNA starvation/stationary phase protection protein [Paenibacillus sp. YN15]
MSVELTSVLNKQIANWGVLFVKLHNFHWYVKGTQFFTLHLKFEELYNEAALHIDDLAERVLAIKGKPLATLSDYLATASVKEAKGTETATEQVAAIIADFETVIAELKAGMKVAEEADDETTGDLLLAIHTSLEKHVWMLSSFLG